VIGRQSGCVPRVHRAVRGLEVAREPAAVEQRRVAQLGGERVAHRALAELEGGDGPRVVARGAKVVSAGYRSS
jgi:hypothetical protein